MIKYLLIFLLISTSVFAGTVEVDGKKVEYDDELSLKSFTNQNFIESDINFSGKVIYASSFTQETPNSEIFPKDTTNVVFVYCHMENVVLPENSMIVNPDCDGSPCWTQPFKAQSDGEDWILDDKGKAKEPINKEQFLMEGKSIAPENIVAKVDA